MARRVASPIPTSEPPGRGLFAYLVLTTVVCGALVMTIEVLGSRVIGPFFGVSLYVWTSLITVTLVSLALGYAVGGVVSDRRATPEALYAVLVGAGVAVLAMPWLKAPVLKGCVPLGLRLGAFASAAVLFGPALFLLGSVSPYVVKIAAREMRSIGRTVGLLSAVSTAGSVLGTILTGFVLISRFGVARTFQGAGFLLVALGAGYFLLFRRRAAWAALLAVPLLLGHPDRLVSKRQPNGTTASVVLEKDGFYGKLKVVEYSLGDRRTRELLMDGMIQGGIDVETGESIYEYPYPLSFLPYALNPGGRTCLVLGAGAGVVPRWFESRGVKTDVVDIDPEVFAAARSHFDLRVSGEEILGDARTFLSTTTKSYDFAVLDVFNGDAVPAHVISREALALVRARLAPRGVLSVNLIGGLARRPFIAASVVRTIGTLFDTVEVFPQFDPVGEPGLGNFIVVAYEGAPRPLDLDLLRSLPIHPMAREGVERFLGRTYRFPEGTGSMVLTDDENPIDFHDRWAREWLRKRVLEETDWDILL